MNLPLPRELSIIGLAASPRAGGNSDKLLDAFLAGAQEAGAETEKIRLAEQSIHLCNGCEKCFANGICVFRDDAALLIEKLWRADLVALSTPVYFYSVTSHAKLLIDRTQALWARKEILHQSRRKGRGVLFGVAATHGPRLFEGMQLIVRYWMKSFYAELAANRYYRRVDHLGDIALHPTAMADARELGRKMIADPNYREEI